MLPFFSFTLVPLSLSIHSPNSCPKLCLNTIPRCCPVNIFCEAVQKSQELYFYLASGLERSLEVPLGYEGSFIKAQNGIIQPVPNKSVQEGF